MEKAAQQRGNPPLHKHLATQTSQKTVGSRPEPLPQTTRRAPKHKRWDRIINSNLQQLFPNPPTTAFQRNINFKEMLTRK